MATPPNFSWVLTSPTADGGTAFAKDTENAFTSGKLEEWRNNGTGKAFVGWDGGLNGLVRDRGGYAINVMADPYNAVGGGVGNQTTAIQAAIDAGGDSIPVIFPGELFQCDSQVVFNPEGTYIMEGGNAGAGAGASIGFGTVGLRSNYGGADAAFTLDAGSSSTVGQRAQFNGLFMFRQNTTGPCMYTRQLKRALFLNTIWMGGSINLDLATGAQGTWNNDFFGCHFWDGVMGIQFASSGVNENHWYGGSFRAQTGSQIVVAGGHNTFNGVEFATCEGAKPIDITADADFTEFFGCRNEQNVAGPASLLDNASGATNTRIFGGNWQSSILASTSYFAGDLTELFAVGDITGLKNQFLENLTLYKRLIMTSGGPFLSADSGSPEGSLTAPIGSMYMRTDGGANTSLYVKESGVGNTGWVGK